MSVRNTEVREDKKQRDTSSNASSPPPEVWKAPRIIPQKAMN